MKKHPSIVLLLILELWHINITTQFTTGYIQLEWKSAPLSYYCWSNRLSRSVTYWYISIQFTTGYIELEWKSSPLSYYCWYNRLSRSVTYSQFTTGYIQLSIFDKLIWRTISPKGFLFVWHCTVLYLGQMVQLTGSKCIPDGAHINHCWANLTMLQKLSKF